jgi:hypothetical protein
MVTVVQNIDHFLSEFHNKIEAFGMVTVVQNMWHGVCTDTKCNILVEVFADMVLMAFASVS